MVMYMFVPFLSKTLVMGALWAGKDSRGGVDLPAQLASVKELLGVTTNWSPVLRVVVPLRPGPSQAVKQVG
jgi:hypothetical protein